MLSTLTVRPQEQRMGPRAPTSEDAGGSKRRMGRDIVYYGGAEGVPTIKDPTTWAVEPLAGALDAGALSSDSLGLLLTVVVEEGDERGRPTIQNGAT